MKHPNEPDTAEPVTAEASPPPIDLRLWLTRQYLDGEAETPAPDEDIRQAVAVMFASERQEARDYQEQLMRRIGKGNELRYRLEVRLEAFRKAIADADLGEGPAFNMAEAIRADDALAESDRAEPEEGERAP